MQSRSSHLERAQNLRLLTIRKEKNIFNLKEMVRNASGQGHWAIMMGPACQYYLAC